MLFGRAERPGGFGESAAQRLQARKPGKDRDLDMKDGFVRVAAATPEIRVADCAYNGEKILKLVHSAPEGTALMVFPELCVTGYTCGDLFAQPLLLKSAEEAVRRLLDSTVDCDALLLVGVPVACGTALYNCAAVCHRGNLLGLVPKSHLPNYAEFYEARQFTPADDRDRPLTYAGQPTVLSRRRLFASRSMPAFCVGVEICEDLWVPAPESARLAAAGATVIANLSASDESVGKADYRRQLVAGQSARLICGYVYADAGEGESSGDLVFSGHDLLAENGQLLAESERFSAGMIVTEFDVERLSAERRRMNTFTGGEALETVYFEQEAKLLELTRPVEPLPFVPGDPQKQAQRCEEILNIQAAGLARRLRHTGSRPVIGLSGGLDSTLALLVAVRACDRLGRPHSDILTVTMPCYGTTGRTLGNARTLAAACGAVLREINIAQAVTQHLADIAHDGSHDVAYENAQARERTQVLMDLANRENGLVVGTGDLSELALGWATYNGDHMSMYGVNASVPKTLVRYLVAYEAERRGGAMREVLLDILDTPVSPELLPPEDGVIAQKTEQIVGPYELHDFYLFHLLRYGCPPAKIYRLARCAFAGRFTDEEIKKWLVTFLRRFFTQQYKRSCLPDGPRVGSVSLSPRGDWRMPSDASAAAWVREAEAL